MTAEEYKESSYSLLLTADGIENAKRPAYTGANTDVLHNFKSVAARLKLTPMEVWSVYFLKHVDAILSAAKDPNIPQAEPLVGRFADAVNYLKLGYALYSEGQGQEKHE